MDTKMTERRLQDLLIELLLDNDLLTPETLNTFEDAGIMTNNKGVVVGFREGEFQITIVKSR